VIRDEMESALTNPVKIVSEEIKECDSPDKIG